MEEMELRDYLSILWRRRWIVILTAALFVLVTAITSIYILEPEYRAFTTLMVINPRDNTQKMEYSDLLLSEKLVMTYREFAKSKVVAEKVIENLRLPMSPDELRSKVNVNPVNGTEILKIEVHNPSPELAAKIANEFARTFIEQVAQLTQLNNIQIIDRAEVPKAPVKPTVVLNIVIAAIVGVAGSVLLIFFLEYMDNTLKSQSDVEKYLALPVLGTVPVFSQQGRKKPGEEQGGIIMEELPFSPATEAFRTLRTNIQFSNIDRKTKSILITSAGLGEGKSTVSANLAAALAQVRKRVLLMDGDLRKPRIHTLFKESNHLGITNVLSGGIDYREALRSTGIEGLYLLTSGPVPPNPVEILGSQSMKKLLKKLEQDFEMVIIDSPPVGLVTDAAVLSTIVDRVILVCAIKHTPVADVKNARIQLQKLNASIAGVVLNKAALKEGRYIGYYNSQLPVKKSQ